MTLDDFPITRRWPAARPDAIQLYSFPTPNGVKASIALEELGLDYEPHLVTLKDEDVRSEAFTSLNPYGKIPAIIDPSGPDGAIGLFESHTILSYLADKTGRLGGAGPRHWEVQKWLSWQVGGLGPLMGQMGHFVKLAKEDVPYARKRYVGEAVRLLDVIEARMDGREWVVDEFSIADIAIAPWLNAIHFYEAEDLVGWDDRPNTQAYVARFFERPAVQKGRSIPDPEG